MDARTVWDWLTQGRSPGSSPEHRKTSLLMSFASSASTEKGVPSSQIVLSGQSLGTGVACALAGRRLAAQSRQEPTSQKESGLICFSGCTDIVPRALILTAPFTSIRELLLDYKLLECVPVLQPLRYFSSVQSKAPVFCRLAHC